MSLKFHERREALVSQRSQTSVDPGMLAVFVGESFEEEPVCQEEWLVPGLGSSKLRCAQDTEGWGSQSMRKQPERAPVTKSRVVGQ